MDGLAVASRVVDELVGGGEVVLAAARLQGGHLQLVLGRERVELAGERVAVGAVAAQRRQAHGGALGHGAQGGGAGGHGQDRRGLRGSDLRRAERRKRGDQADRADPSAPPISTECSGRRAAVHRGAAASALVAVLALGLRLLAVRGGDVDAGLRLRLRERLLDESPRRSLLIAIRSSRYGIAAAGSPVAMSAPARL